MELSHDWPGLHACADTHRRRTLAPSSNALEAQTEMQAHTNVNRFITEMQICLTYTHTPGTALCVVGVAECGHAGKETRRWNMLEEDMLDGWRGCQV